MSAMVFLKITADISFLFMMMGPAAVHFGAGSFCLIITCVSICVSHVLSFLIEGKKPKLRLFPYILPFACILIPGISISWAVMCGIILAYAVFCAATRRYMAEREVQITIFKVSLGACGAMLFILLLVSATALSYTIVMICLLITSCCSILLMRSLRHDPEIYGKPSYQAVNIAIVAAAFALSALLGSRPVVRGILNVLKVIYTAIAYVFLYIVSFIIKGISYLVTWISTLIGPKEAVIKKPELPKLEDTSANDLFKENVDVIGLPLWLKILGIAILSAIAILIIILIFRRLAGVRASRISTSKTDEESSKANFGQESARHPARSQGVRKQYRKYLNLLRSEGYSIDPAQTSADISRNAPLKYRTESAEELRSLYIEARYNGIVSKAAAERAKEIVRELKKS